MKSKNDLNEFIYFTTLKIHREFPELVKYLDELPRESSLTADKAVNNKELKSYLELLNDLIDTYGKEHEKDAFVKNHFKK